MTVIEGRDQLDLPRQQHPVAENVTTHVPDAHDREGLRLDVFPPLREVPLHRLPCTAGGDPDDLVVIPVGAPGSEGVVQPESVFRRDAVGHVREGGGPLVRRDDQIRIGLVPADHVLGRQHLTGLVQIVGDVEQSPHERLVLLARLLGHRLPIGELLERDEAALRPSRNDHGILDHLGVHQAENLRPEVVRPVRVADAPAGDLGTPEVDALHSRRPHPHLVEQLGACDIGEFAHGELQREVRNGAGDPSRSRTPVPIVVRANRLLDQPDEPPKRPVVRKELDVTEQVVQRTSPFRDLAPTFLHPGEGTGVELGLEKPEQGGSESGIRDQRLRDRQPAGYRAQLERIRRIGPQHLYFAPRQAGRDDQRVHHVVARVSVADGHDRRGQERSTPFGVEHPAVGVLNGEAEDRGGRSLSADEVRRHADDPQARVLENRHEFRQDQALDPEIELQLRIVPERPHRVLRLGERDRRQATVGVHRLQLQNVVDRVGRVRRGLVLCTEGVGIDTGEASGLVGGANALEPLTDAIGPGADQLPDRDLDVGRVDARQRLLRSEVEVQPCLVALSQREVVVENLGLELSDQHELDRLSDLARELVLREDHHDRPATAQRILPDRDPHALGVVRGEHDLNVGADLLRGGQEELLLGERVEDRVDLLEVVRTLARPRRLDDLLQLVAQNRDVLGLFLVGLRGEQPDETVLAHGRAVGSELLDADVVHTHEAMDGRARIRFGDDQHRTGLHELPKAHVQVGQPNRVRVGRIRFVAQHTQTRARLHADCPIPTFAHDVVAAVAEEDERAVPQPAEEVLDLGDLFRPRRDLVSEIDQLRDHPVDRIHHRPEVVRDADDILQAIPYLGPERLEVGLVGHPSEFAVHQRLAILALGGRTDLEDPAIFVALEVEHRVDEVLDGQVLCGEKLPERVHHERTLRDVRSEDRHRRVPALVLDVRIEGLDVHARALAALEEAESTQHHVGQRIGAARFQEIRRRLAEEDLRKADEQLRLIGELALQLAAYRIDDR